MMRPVIDRLTRLRFLEYVAAADPNDERFSPELRRELQELKGDTDDQPIVT